MTIIHSPDLEVEVLREAEAIKIIKELDFRILSRIVHESCNYRIFAECLGNGCMVIVDDKKEEYESHFPGLNITEELRVYLTGSDGKYLYPEKRHIPGNNGISGAGKIGKSSGALRELLTDVRSGRYI